MFEKIGRMAEEAAATGVSLSRRGFFSRFAALAGGAALGLVALWPAAAQAGRGPCPGGARAACSCKVGGVYCYCCASDPNLYYCCQGCAQFCRNHKH
jgi:hypothetical protein